jgi:PEP-CTERM motif
MLGLGRWIRLVAISAVAVGLAHGAHAQTTFDVADDFSLTGNPNGSWSYGYSTTLTGSLVLNPISTTISGVDFWGMSSGSIFAIDPSSFHNPTQSVITLSGLPVQPGQFAFHPGPNGEYEKARLTLSSAGDYSISGSFAGAAPNGTTTDVHILLNGVSIFDGVVNGFGAGTGPSFSLTRSLSAGDALDFAVGYGANLNYISDTTTLAAEITTAVPEPSTFLLLGAGALLLMPVIRWRAKTG